MFYNINQYPVIYTLSIFFLKYVFILLIRHN